MYVNATEFLLLYLQHSFMYQIKNSVSQEERDTVGFDIDGDEAILGPIAQYNPATGITKTVLGYEFWGMYNEYAYDDRAQRDVKYEDAFQGIAVDGEGKVYFGVYSNFDDDGVGTSNIMKYKIYRFNVEDKTDDYDDYDIITEGFTLFTEVYSFEYPNRTNDDDPWFGQFCEPIAVSRSGDKLYFALQKSVINSVNQYPTLKVYELDVSSGDISLIFNEADVPSMRTKRERTIDNVNGMTVDSCGNLYVAAHSRYYDGVDCGALTICLETALMIKISTSSSTCNKGK